MCAGRAHVCPTPRPPLLLLPPAPWRPPLLLSAGTGSSRIGAWPRAAQCEHGYMTPEEEQELAAAGLPDI